MKLKITQDEVALAANYVALKDGGNVSFNGQVLLFDRGYSVGYASMFDHNGVKCERDQVVDIVSSLLISLRDDLFVNYECLPDSYFGFWYDAINKTLYCDLSVWVASKWAAMELGEKYEQLAIWDFKNNEAIMCQELESRKRESYTLHIGFDPSITQDDIESTTELFYKSLVYHFGGATVCKTMGLWTKDAETETKAHYTMVGNVERENNLTVFLSLPFAPDNLDRINDCLQVFAPIGVNWVHVERHEVMAYHMSLQGEN